MRGTKGGLGEPCHWFPSALRPGFRCQPVSRDPTSHLSWSPSPINPSRHDSSVGDGWGGGWSGPGNSLVDVGSRVGALVPGSRTGRLEMGRCRDDTKTTSEGRCRCRWGTGTRTFGPPVRYGLRLQSSEFSGRRILRGPVPTVYFGDRRQDGRSRRWSVGHWERCSGIRSVSLLWVV